MAMGLLRGHRRAAWLLLPLLAAAVFFGCRDEEGGPGVYPARGIVEDVDRENAQVLIDHEDIAGLMPAMTMNFAVPDAEVLARLATGQVITFDLRFTGRSYEVDDFEVVGEADYDAGWRRLGETLVRTSPAPEFELIDQEGRPATLASFGDRLLVVDFVYTECPGPCPIQTSNQVALQRRIPRELLEGIHFVSISLDPRTDTPEVMRAYALARGADLAHWSFLTGDEAPVAEVVKRFGVGSVRKDDGSIDHTLITFLVADGRVMETYTMRDGRDDTLFADLVTLARTRALTSARAGASGDG